MCGIWMCDECEPSHLSHLNFRRNASKIHEFSLFTNFRHTVSKIQDFCPITNFELIAFEIRLAFNL